MRDVDHRPLPPNLKDLAAALVHVAAAAAAAAAAPPAVHGIAAAAEQLVRPGAFRPDAALVNYYYAGDTLGGHRDDAEADLGQPLVALSLGCPGLLLVGGETRVSRVAGRQRRGVAEGAVLLRSAQSGRRACSRHWRVC
jgi:alkylated DNA repair dioxygenase AlkB